MGFDGSDGFVTEDGGMGRGTTTGDGVEVAGAEGAAVDTYGYLPW